MSSVLQVEIFSRVYGLSLQVEFTNGVYVS